MILSNMERYNFYKAENEAKKGYNNLLKYIEEQLLSHDIEVAIAIIKASGIAVNLYGSKKHKKMFDDLVKHLLSRNNINEKEKIDALITESVKLEDIVVKFNQIRSYFFDGFEQVEEKFQVASYLLSLESYLGSLNNSKEDSEKSFNIHQKADLYNSAAESSGMILKYFMFKKYEFSGSKKAISPLFLEISNKHINFSSYWNEINDLLEYWKYSDLDITVDSTGMNSLEIIDSEFELNNLISNDRFLNLREVWQMNTLGEITTRITEENKKQDLLSEATDGLTYLFASLYFGSPLLEDKVENIKLSKWIEAYQLLVKESRNFLKNNLQKNNSKLKDGCLSRTKKMWKEIYKKNGFSSAEFDVILDYFTFNHKSQDLIDCPFIPIDDQLVILPSLTVHADAARAISSNFLNKNVNLDFKGIGFENRMKALFDMRKIRNSRLYKRTDETEFECDIAFVIENDIFFVECKAHVQPFTTRQHANHLYKLYKETFQLNRIADFFSDNIHLVREQLKLHDDFIIKKFHRILLTTSMIGTPMNINGVYIIDESAFTMFLNRKPPSLMLIKKGEYKKEYTDKFDIYEGDITVNKVIQFLGNPPQIQILKEFYAKNRVNLELFDIKRFIKINRTIHVGDEIDENEDLLNKFYSGSQSYLT
ncbi:hypothetical protein ABU162_17160 [Paenibacillus thiaminolyticus]|uniref:hypothetical protein n=1 Tax=Paenibacillus thiaminolyticus TaxID=49283 RepID=UPI0035A61272